jgi:hypothetical protein
MPILGSTGVFRSASKSQTAVIPTEQAISLPPPGSVIKMKLLGKNGTESLKPEDDICFINPPPKVSLLPGSRF